MEYQPPTKVNVFQQRDYWVAWLKRVGLFFPFILISAYFGYHTLLETRMRPLEQQLNKNITLFIASFNRQIGIQGTIVNLIKAEVTQQSANQTRNIDPERVKEIFSRYLLNTPTLYQLRWLDAEGNETIKISLEPEGLKVWPEAILVNKSHRPYFDNAQSLNSGQVYLSDINLNQEYGRIELPIKITSRAISQIDNSSLDLGFVIANFNLNAIFQAFNAEQTEQLGFYIADRHGHWLANPQPDSAWSHEFSDTPILLPEQFPALWDAIQSGHSSTAQVIDQRLWLWQSLDTEFGNLVGENDAQLHVLGSVYFSAYTRIRNETMLLVISLSLLAMLFVGWTMHKMVVDQLTKKHLNQKLRKEQAALNQANQSLGETLLQQQTLQDELVDSKKLASMGMMVAGVAHELNTPVGAALMAVTTLQEKQTKIEQQLSTGLTKSALQEFITISQGGLDLAQKNIQRCAELVQSFKRLSLERSSAEIDSFDLSRLIQDLLTTLHPKIKRSQIRISTECPMPLMLNNYPGIISQILQNLIENALVHGFDKNQQGNIVIRASLQPNATVKLSVIDNGKGIPESLQKQIFDPFVTTGRGSGSTGLGLHLIHQWVTKLMGGRINVTSSPGETRFDIITPKDIENPEG